MGEPITRLNPQIESRLQKTFLAQASALLLSIVMLLPVKEQEGRGRKAYDYRKLLVLCILRILLRKTYADYEIEMRTDPRYYAWLDMKALPGKSTLQRFMEWVTMWHLLELNYKLIQERTKLRFDVIVDSSGIRIIGRSIWYCLRIKKDILRREFEKVHLAVCSDVMLILNWRISASKRNDSPFLRVLLAPFQWLRLVFADKGYTSRINHQFVADKRGSLFSPFKSNARGRSKGSPAWKIAHWLWSKFTTLYMGIYHQRSKVEAVFHALKERYGDELYSTKKATRRNEMAIRFIAYNVRVLLYWHYAREQNMNLWVRAKRQ